MDGSSIDPWSKGYIGAVLEAGYMAGYPDGTFKARNPIKRGEAVFALNNTKKDHEESEEITESIDEEGISVPTSPSSSSGGGGGGGSQTIAVTTITVSGAGGASTITTVDGTLQMSVNVAPAEASNKSVTWSVTPQTGSATISSTGLLTAVANGTITVVATAQDGSGITGSRQIIISGQSTEGVSNKAELEAAIDNNSITNIVLISSITDDIAQSTARTSSFTIDFGSHVLTGNLDITANNLSMITFNGDAGTRIDGDITSSNRCYSKQ
ncbi:Ig-like domain-containing protein [Petrocella sp. FN5]|uniref:Ig-like domain-containing protein n=1 Tax=Petrocella sp. FN5 TaxID=3032002 RepID=UPI0023DCD380|nr:Ig-like domain-containing protein [Petrocella sp. FN5]MDF1617946.1 Ig-like domain-containing protein [Petrocella sp. FN5]